MKGEVSVWKEVPVSLSIPILPLTLYYLIFYSDGLTGFRHFLHSWMIIPRALQPQVHVQVKVGMVRARDPNL